MNMNHQQVLRICRRCRNRIRKIHSAGEIGFPDKVNNHLNRLLRVELRGYFKPLLVIYFTPQTMAELNKNKTFLQVLEKKVAGKFKMIILPAFSDKETRAELWYKGNLLTKSEKQLFESNLWVFNELQSMYEIAGLNNQGRPVLRPYKGPDLSGVHGIMV